MKHKQVLAEYFRQHATAEQLMNGVLMKAIRESRLDVVEALLDIGVDAATLDNTAVIAAARNGSTAIVRALVRAGADIHVHADEPLFKAANSGHIDTVRALLELGADPRAVDYRAVRFAKDRNIQWLIQRWPQNGTRSASTSTPGPA